MKIESK